MALQNCIKCGKLIGETPSGYCESCKTTDPTYSNLHKVKDYLYDNPNSTLIVVSEATGVSVNEISRFIRDGAIVEVSLVSAIKKDNCSCGKPLEGKERICKDCKRENEKAAERAMKSLAKNIEPSHSEARKRPATAEFFTRSK